MSSAKGISSVPDGLSEDLADFLRQMRLRLIDIQAGRVAALFTSTTGGTSGTPAPAPAPGPPGPPGPPAVDIPDLTPPPTVSGVVVTAGLDFVFIDTDAPTITEGSGYNRTLVYGAKYSGVGPLPTFLDAVLVHEFVGQVGSFTSEPATQWHIWLKWRTNDGVLSTDPAGGANGYQVTTGVDVSMLLTALAGSITESELYGALNTRINLIDDSDGVVGSVNHRILTETTAREALASDVTTLEATVAGNTAAISTEVTTRATVDGHLSALYTVRAEITQEGETVVGGFGLSGTSGGTEGPTIDFGVIADRFWVGAPSGDPGAAIMRPFVVQASPTTINGVAVPVGVYMDAAYIQNGTIVDAKIGVAAITSAKIVSLSATKITAGTIAVGEYIQSSDYVNSVSGWRIGGNMAEFDTAYLRGTLTANRIISGSFAGQTFTGGTFQTATSGKRVAINEGGDNEARFWGDRGTGTVEVLASIGVTAVGLDNAVAIFGTADSTHIGLYAISNTNNGIVGASTSDSGTVGTSVSHHGVEGVTSSFSTSRAGVYGAAASGANGVLGEASGSNTGVKGTSVSGYAIEGFSTSGGGVYGYSGSGYGVRAAGNATKSALFLTPVTSAPSNVDLGGVAIILGTVTGAYELCIANGGGWVRVRDLQPWNAA